MNSFVIPTDSPGVATPVRVYAPDGTVYRKSTAAGGADPAGLVAFDGTEVAAGKYNVATVEIVGSGGEFLFTMPAGIPAGAYQFRAFQGGSLISALSAGDVGYWDGEDFSIGFTVADRAKLDTLFSGGIAAAEPAITGAAFGSVGAETAVYWAYTFTRPIDLDGWQKIAFTVKRDLFSDDDSGALISIVVTNPPAAGTDGIKTHNGRIVDNADSLRGQAQIIATATSPDTILFVQMLPNALLLPPSPDSAPYSFEIDYWNPDGIKRQFGRGEFSLARSVRRGVVAP